MTGFNKFKIVSGLFSAARRNAQNRHQKKTPQLGIFKDGEQKKAERNETLEEKAEPNETLENLKPGWFYWKLGRLTGPFDDAEILDLYDQGELQEDSEVTLLNVPLATLLNCKTQLLKDPAKQLDFQTMAHLQKPCIQNAKKEHTMAINPELLEVGDDNSAACRLPDSADTEEIAEDWAAADAEAEEYDGKAFVVESEASEMHCKVDENVEMESADLRRNKVKVMFPKTECAPSKKAWGETLKAESEALKMDTLKAETEALKMGTVETRPCKTASAPAKTARQPMVVPCKTASDRAKTAARGVGNHESQKTKPKPPRRGPSPLRALARTT
jgi:hypothetical protein